MNTEFLAGVVVARMLEGMKFALGPTATARKQVLERNRRLGPVEGLSCRRLRAWELCGGQGLAGDPVVVCDRTSHRVARVPRECASSTPLVPKHPPITSRRLCRPVVHESFAARVIAMVDAARVVAGPGRNGSDTRLRGHRNGAVDSPRSFDTSPLVSASDSRPAELRVLGRGLLRKYNLMARPSISADEGWDVSAH